MDVCYTVSTICVIFSLRHASYQVKPVLKRKDAYGTKRTIRPHLQRNARRSAAVPYAAHERRAGGGGSLSGGLPAVLRTDDPQRAADPRSAAIPLFDREKGACAVLPHRGEAQGD